MKDKEKREKNSKTVEEKSLLASIFTRIFLVVFAIVFFIDLFFNTNDLIHYRMIDAFYIGASVLGLLLVGFYINGFFSNKLKLLHKSSFYIFVCIMIFILQIIVAKAIYFEVGWDVSAIIKNADFLVNNPLAFEHNYFMMYPNNLFLLFIFAIICKISEGLAFIDYKFLLVVINVIMVDLAILFTILSVKKLFNKKATIVSAVLFIVLFGFSPWIVVPYSDTLSMVFPIAIFYLYLKLKDLKNDDDAIKKVEVEGVVNKKNKSLKRRTKQFIILISIGILATIGSQIKPTIIIVLIAILIAEFIRNIKSFKGILALFASIFIVLLSFVTWKGIYNKKIENYTINGYNISDRYDVEFPFTHFAMMGLQSVHVENRGTIYGAYVPEDVVFTESIKGKDEKAKANIEEIKRRLKSFGPVGYLKFLVGKGLWVLSDGSFYYGGEGHFMISEPYATGTLATKLQNIFLSYGDKFFGLVHIFQGAWLLILFLVIYPLFEKGRFKYDNSLFVIRITITGIVLFLLLFEARSRYLINHIPFFILLAGYGFNLVYERFLKEII